MKAIHRSRIDGVIILAIIAGIFCGKFLGLTGLLIIVPVVLLWLFEYDINSHAFKNQKG